jgi:Effector Associated Constant Component 1
VRTHAFDGEGAELDEGWHIQVITGGDALRQERLTRALHAELRQRRELTVAFAPSAAPVAAGAKAGALGEVALWAAAGTAGPRVLVTLIREWCAKERHRRVELTYRGNSLTLPAHPDETQERIIRAFMEQVDRAEAADAAEPSQEPSEESAGPGDGPENGAA